MVDDAAHDVLQERDTALVRGDDAFPVPLVDVDGVEVVHLLVAADGVHIGIEPLAGGEAVGTEGEALPFGERVDDLGGFMGLGDVEADGALDAVEVVVKAGVRVDEQGSGHAAQTERVCEIFFEAAL